MILSAGLTPARQKILVFDAFQRGGVNRARKVYEGASGKVLNVALALHHLGAPVRSLALADASLEGKVTRRIDASSPTRVCTTLLCGGEATELVENAGPVRPEELEAFAAAFAEEAAGARAVVLTGSLPEGTPARYLRDLIAGVSVPVVLDARGPELLEALHERPFLVKPNRRELEATPGGTMEALNERGAGWVLVTDGAGPVRLTGGKKNWTFRPPAAEVVNPIGCGDALAAGVAWSVAQGRDPVEAVRFGIAAATESLGHLIPGELDAGRVTRLVERVEVA